MELAKSGPTFAVTVLAVLAWYLSNIAVLLSNKALLTQPGFKRPVFLSLCHMAACAALGYALSVGDLTKIKPLQSSKQAIKVLLLASIFCASIVLGNLSLQHIPISFNQAIGATTPFFTAVFALVLQGARETRGTYLTLIPIAGGMVIASGGEPSFAILGFTACLLATCCRALKSVVQAMLMTDPMDKLDPMSLLLYMSTFSVILLLPTLIILDPGVFGEVMHLLQSRPALGWALVGNSCLAYAVNLTNFLVTLCTNALTLQVLGNMKGIVAAAVSVAIFKNPVSMQSTAGYFVTICGVLAYSEVKKRSKLQEVPEKPNHPCPTEADNWSDNDPLLPINKKVGQATN